MSRPSKNMDAMKEGKVSRRKDIADVRLRLMAELMRNSRRSDRDLAKAIGISQPTVTRIRSRLEKEGYIKEYTMIPDFTKLGFEIMSITFLRRPKVVSAEELARIVAMGKELAEKKGMKTIVALRGMGLDLDVAIVAFHEDYASHLEHLDAIRAYPYADIESVQSFLINLQDEVQYRPLTFQYLAKYLAEKAETEERIE